MPALPNHEGHVLVIGASGMDIVGRASADLLPGISNPGRLRISHGGVARNVAENLQRLGVQAVLITAIGDDLEGGQLLARAAEIGVDVDHAILVPEAKTGAYLALLDEDGGLKLGLDDMEVTGAISHGHLQSRGELFETAAAVVVDGNLHPKTLATAVGLARKADVPVVVDPTSRSLAEKFRAHLANVWLISPNQGEAEALLGGTGIEGGVRDPLEAARRIVAQGAEIAMISRAEFGVSYASAAGSGNVPARQTEVIDPTGAGDALLATVVFGLLNDIPLDEAIRLGVTAAALTLRVSGTVIPDLSLEMLYDQLI